jgi:lysozyme
VTYLYAASKLFKTPVPKPVTRYAACGAYLRTGPARTAPSKTLIKTNAKVLVATGVAGTAWSTTCAGKAVAGKAWYRISAVNGRTVRSLYGVTYLYAAAGLFKPAITAPAPTPTPTPTPPIAPEVVPTPPAFLNMTEGIDISHWQGTISWPAVASAGKRFAFMKASQSTDYVDPTYVGNRQQAHAAGLHVGAYHFAQPDAAVGDAVAEADHFVFAAAPSRGDLLPVLDLEQRGGLSPAELTAWVQAYVERIYERIGVRALIYTSPNFWKNFMGDTQWFATNGYDILWVAHWTADTTPLVPAGNWAGDGWTFWQYTSDGAVPGITGRVDLDRYRSKDFTRVLIP